MDHYKILGISRSASKEEIKQAFRKLAMEFHPDKHSQSTDHLRESAACKFRRISEAYENLIDDRKRADYNPTTTNSYSQRRYGGGGDANAHTDSHDYGYGYSRSARRRRSRSDFFSKFEIGLRFLTARSFLLNATFFCVLAGAMYVVDAGGQALWSKQNTGKSFEEAMDSLQKKRRTTSKD
ncbi:hypothetical protein M569_07371, partial [Genlisea aurea]